MKNTVQIGDQRYFERKVRPEDQAAFENDRVHPVYSTFALSRDAEWVCRLFVLDMKEAHEEGIGTFIEVIHCSPAAIGSLVRFDATVESLDGTEIICAFTAKCGDRLVAKGRQGQRVLPKERIAEVFAKAGIESS